MTIHITQKNIDAFIGALEQAIVIDQAIDLAKVAANAGITTDATRDYRNVARYSEVDLEQQRDFLDAGRVKEAILIDAAEPSAHKAWRHILDVHSRVRSILIELDWIKRAEGKGYVKDMLLRDGTIRSAKVSNADRHNALEVLSYLRNAKREAWQALYAAEGLS